MGQAELLSALRNPPELLGQLRGFENLVLAGGFLRDKFLGRTTRDLDLFAPEPLAPLLTELTRLTGQQPFELSARFGTHRLVLDDWEIDVSPLHPKGLAEDITRRDYTINTLLIQTAKLGPKAGLADLLMHPLALQDLASRTLRLTSRQAIESDPLRIMRGYRFAAQLGFTPTSDTRQAWAELSSLCIEPAAERLHDELLSWFGAEGPLGETVRWAAEDGVLWQLFPVLKDSVGSTQNDYHHLDVWEHTLLCLTKLDTLYRDLPEELHTYNSEFKQAWDQQIGGATSGGCLTRLSLLLHDIGKPATREVQQDGHISFYGHQETGVELAEPALQELKFSHDETEFILTQIREHLRLGFYSEHQPLPPKLVYRFIRRLGTATPLALLHSIADCQGTGGALAEGSLLQHIHAAREIMQHYVAGDQISAPPVLLDGNEIMELLQIKPSRLVGDLKESLLEATAAGEVSTKDQAVTYVRRLSKLLGKPESAAEQDQFS